MLNAEGSFRLLVNVNEAEHSEKVTERLDLTFAIVRSSIIRLVNLKNEYKYKRPYISPVT